MRDKLGFAVSLFGFAVLMVVAVLWGRRGDSVLFYVCLSVSCLSFLTGMLLAISSRIERKFDHLEEVIRECLTARRVADPEHDAQTDSSADGVGGDSTRKN